MNQTDPQLRRNRMLLVAIFALFFIPLLLAMLMRSEWWDFTPPGTTNAGRLLGTRSTPATGRHTMAAW